MAGIQSRSASAEMARVLDIAPRISAIDLGDAGAVTTPWRHGALRGPTKAMDQHVFIAFVGATANLVRYNGRRSMSGWTRPGTVTLIGAGTEARWDMSGALDVVHFYIEPARLRRMAEEFELGGSDDLLDRTAEPDPTGSHLLRLLSEVGGGSTAADALYARTLADSLCAHLLRSHRGDAPQRKPSRGGLAPARLKRVLARIEDNLAAKTGLVELASLAGLSTFHFCRAFKQSTGLPPHAWRQLKRMERARTMIESTDLPVTEIAGAVGYEDPGRFAMSFRKAYGRSPSAFRRERR